MDFRDSQINLADLKPNNRLKVLKETSRCILISNSESPSQYYKISNELYKIANHHYRTKNFEEAFVMFLKYKYLINKIKNHPQYRSISVTAMATSHYRLSNVEKKIVLLGEELYRKFRRIYKLTSAGIASHDGTAYGERRPTVSTVKSYQSDVSLRYNLSYIDRRMGVALFQPTLTDKHFNKLHGHRREARCFRTLTIPFKLTTIFSYESAANTKMNLETVAFLVGKEESERELVITHLIFPKQLGYSDYFQIVNIEKVYEFLEEYNLLLMGWIHSHPIEELYLTSADIHFHCDFQRFIPEAVAIVYAAKYTRSEIFNLTPNYGLKFISDCELLGFHVHPTEPPVTMVSQHALIDTTARLCVKDFRNDQDVICFPYLDGESSTGNYTDIARRIEELRDLEETERQSKKKETLKGISPNDQDQLSITSENKSSESDGKLRCHCGPSSIILNKEN